MTRAAEELGVTPGAVSRHVRALEERMETRLFLRRATGLELTTTGETLAQSLGEAFDRMAEAVSGARLRRLRPLSIGVYGYFASRFLLPRWPDLIASCPGLAVDLHTGLNPLEMLPSRYDAVIAVSDALPRTGLVTHKLVPIATVPVGAPALLRNGPPDFATAPLLHARPRPDDWRRWLDHAGFSAVADEVAAVSKASDWPSRPPPSVSASPSPSRRCSVRNCNGAMSSWRTRWCGRRGVGSFCSMRPAWKPIRHSAISSGGCVDVLRGWTQGLRKLPPTSNRIQNWNKPRAPVALGNVLQPVADIAKCPATTCEARTPDRNSGS